MSNRSRRFRLDNEDYLAMVDRLREARSKAGLSQEEVARFLGKPQSYVSKVELAQRRIDPIELLAFARLYGRSLNSFLAVSRNP